MRILEVKSIPVGSSSYVSDMLKENLMSKMNIDVNTVENMRQLSKNPLNYYSFYKQSQDHDIIHAHLGKASQMIGFLCNKKKLKISTLHGFQNYKHYTKINYFTAVSKAVKEHFINQGAKPSTIHIIPNGVEYKFLDIQRIPKKQSKFTLVQIGHLHKNTEKSIEIIHILRQRNIDVELILAGSGDMTLINKTILKYGLESFIHFTGFIHNIEEVYKKADILISTSTLEGFCMPILEAMASGIPVVTYDNLGSSDFFTDGTNGFYATDSLSFANAIENIISNFSLRQSFYENNKKIAKNYTWDNISKIYFDYFSECLKKVYY